MRPQCWMVVCVMSLVLVVVQSVAVQEANPTRYDLIYAATVGGTTYGVAVAAASLANKYTPLPGLPKMQVSVVPGKGTVEHTRQLIEGVIDIGLSSLDSAS